MLLVDTIIIDQFVFKISRSVVITKKIIRPICNFIFPLICQFRVNVNTSQKNTNTEMILWTLDCSFDNPFGNFSLIVRKKCSNNEISTHQVHLCKWKPFWEHQPNSEKISFKTRMKFQNFGHFPQNRSLCSSENQSCDNQL